MKSEDIVPEHFEQDEMDARTGEGWAGSAPSREAGSTGNVRFSSHAY